MLKKIDILNMRTYVILSYHSPHNDSHAPKNIDFARDPMPFAKQKIVYWLNPDNPIE
jgi:hypothetical protein